MVLGIVLTVGVILAAPKFLKGDGEGGFFRPKPNPDAQPVAADSEDADVPAPEQADRPARGGEQDDGAPDYDFYELLPGEEVALTDAQLAAAAKAEQDRARREQERLAGQAAEEDAPEADQPQPLPEASTPRITEAGTEAGTETAPVSASGSAGNDTPYILQAGAFGASGDAEAVKARIALLGLNARVESARIGGKTVYRVRMGPYGSASELATAKDKLASGGLPALAIKAK
jgi:cell division protein FtsN